MTGTTLRLWRCGLAALLLIPTTCLAEQDDWRINIPHGDIREFITQVSKITGKSFIIDQRIKGTVTVISDTPMDADAVYQLFLSVLRVQGFAAVPAGNVTKIVQQVLAKQSGNPNDFQNLDSEELITHVVPVKNTSAPDLVKIIRPLIPQHAHIAGLLKPNVILIGDYASNINRLRTIVEKIDVAENLAVRIVDLKEAWVEDMIVLLEQLAPDEIGKAAKGPNKVTVVANERTNSLVLKGEEAVVTRVLELVQRLDVPANRSGTVQVVRLAHADAEELAEILKNLTSDGDEQPAGQDVKVSIQADVALNALVIRANPSSMIELKDIIHELDVRRLQVLIEAAVVEVTTDFSRQLGSELFLADATSNNVPLGMTSPTGTLAQILQSLATGGTAAPSLGDTPFLAGGRVNSSGSSFAVIVRALATNGDVNLLSTPSVTTMDNNEAKIVVGQKVPFRTGSTTTGSQGANNPFTTIQREDVGLTLQVTPHVHDGELIRLEIHQEVSEVDERSFQTIGSEG